MCGIVAQFNYRRGAIDQEKLLEMRDVMACRGPDGTGYWTSENGRVALAHRRLSIIDPSERGAQPMTDDRRGRMITYNGEIYNYQDLRAELQHQGYRFKSDTDTEVLLYLYDREGAEMVEKLRGMYAFALYDEERQGMLLARDPYGIKPLYYADDGATLRVASQVRALRAHQSVDTAPQPAGHVGFFLWGHVPEPYTFYRGIRALPAGHTLWVEEGGQSREQQFFSISDTIAAAENGRYDLSPARIKRRLRESLISSVKHHLVSDVEVGLFLSAGIDSATLAGLVSDVRDEPLRTLTLGFEEYRGTSHDEVPLAEAVAEHYGMNHRTVWISRSDFESERERLLEMMDQPSIDGVNAYFVSRAAAQAGLKVALSGLGGDELFGGYAGFDRIPRLVRTLGYLPGVSTLGKGLRVVSAPVLKKFTSPKYAGLLEYGSSYEEAYLLSRGLFMPWELPDVLDEELVHEGWRTLRPFARLSATASAPEDAGFKLTALLSCWYMRNQLLRDADWASMAHGVEVRVPLVEHKLLQQIAALRAANPQIGKQDLAQTPTKSLPEEVFNRPKTGFSIPVRQWLLDGTADVDRSRGLRGWAKYVYSRYT